MAGSFKLAEVFAELTIHDGAFNTAINRVHTNLQGLDNALQKIAGAARKIFLVGAAAATGATIAFGSFEQTMARVLALTGANTEEFAQLNKAARDLGKSTVFSARQAAAAMSEFALQGFTTQQILEALPATLNLAAAGQVGMAQATDIAAGAMRSMGIETEEMSRVVDVLAKGATSSATDIPLLGDALKALGPVAASSGADIEDVVAQVGLLSNVMIRGEAAGTALRNIYLRLQRQPAEVKKALDSMGISVEDSEGKMKSLATIVDELNAATASMTEVQRNATISSIGGLRATAALTQLLNQGGDAIRAYTTVLREAGGTAERVANIQLNTLFGRVKLLQSALVEFAIRVGETIAPAVNALLKVITSVLVFMGNLPNVVIIAGVALAGLITVLAGVVAVAALTVSLITAVSGAIVGLTAAAGGAAVALTAMLAPLLAFIIPILPVVAAVVGIVAAVAGLAYLLRDVLAPILRIIMSIVTPLFNAAKSLLGAIVLMVVDLISLIAGPLLFALENMARVFNLIADGIGLVVKGVVILAKVASKPIRLVVSHHPLVAIPRLFSGSKDDDDVETKETKKEKRTREVRESLGIPARESIGDFKFIELAELTKRIQVSVSGEKSAVVTAQKTRDSILVENKKQTEHLEAIAESRGIKKTVGAFGSNVVGV